MPNFILKNKIMTVTFSLIHEKNAERLITKQNFVIVLRRRIQFPVVVGSGRWQNLIHD